MGLLNDNEQAAAAAATKGTVLPAGSYLGHITGVEKWKNGTSLLWKFKVAQGQDMAGREVWSWTPLSEKGIFRTKERFAQLGIPLDADEDQIEGLPVQVTVAVEINPANNEPRNQVTAMAPYTGDDLPPDPVANPDADIDAAFGTGLGALTEDEEDGLL